jgi:hypothetical protein
MRFDNGDVHGVASGLTAEGFDFGSSKSKRG